MALFFSGKIHTIGDPKEIYQNENEIQKIRQGLLAGDAFLVKRYFSKEKVLEIRNYLCQVGRSSLPNYRKIEEGCPNFHRLNRWDGRAFVEGCFHQFVFFPWNQDIFDLFKMLEPVYWLKNIINGDPKEKYLGQAPQEGCIARLAFQFYPKGTGELHKHRDAVDGHQIALPIMILTKKGSDFKEGGVYFEKENGEKVMGDDYCDEGDIIYYNPIVPHGVLKIDPGIKENWLAFEGRWMLLIAVNKLFNNKKVADAVDLEKNLNQAR